MITAFTWAITVLSFTGTALNVRKNIRCFYLWAVGNIAWLGFDLWSGLYSRAVLDAVHLAFAVWGALRGDEKAPRSEGLTMEAGKPLTDCRGQTPWHRGKRCRGNAFDSRCTT